MKAFDRSPLGLALLLIFGPFRWPLYLDSYWKKAHTKVHAFVDRRVQRAIENQREGKKEDSEHKRYVLLEEMTRLTQDPYDLRIQILNAFFPVRDTAAIAFGGIIFELARHPCDWEILRTEVAGIEKDQEYTFELLHSLLITKSIIDVSPRLHPTASRLARTALKHTILPKGGGSTGESPTLVPKGTVVEMDLYTLQRDPTFWGEDADEFKPSRRKRDERFGKLSGSIKLFLVGEGCVLLRIWFWFSWRTCWSGLGWSFGGWRIEIKHLSI